MTISISTQNTSMDIQPRLGGVAKIHFYLGYKIDILRDDELKFDRTIQCNAKNYKVMKL